MGLNKLLQIEDIHGGAPKASKSTTTNTLGRFARSSSSTPDGQYIQHVVLLGECSSASTTCKVILGREGEQAVRGIWETRVGRRVVPGAVTPHGPAVHEAFVDGLLGTGQMKHGDDKGIQS